jgi:transketolase
MMTYENLLEEMIKQDDRFVVMTAENRAAIRNLPGKISKNFVDVGIAEQTLIGMAAGLALRGRIPITHALASFLTLRPFEFIRTDVGIGSLPVKLVGAVPGFLSEANGPTHQAVEDIALMRLIPQMQIFCPADEDELLNGFEEIAQSPNPAYIRYTNQKALIKHPIACKIGEAEVLQQGSDITLITYGLLFNETLKAKKILEENGFSVGVINLRYLNPIDEEAILESVKKSFLTVCIEDHFQIGGLYSITAELLLKNRITGNVLPIALKNKFFKPALLGDVLEYEGFTGKQIADKILYALKFEVSGITDNK